MRSSSNIPSRILHFMLTFVIPKSKNGYISNSTRSDGMGAQAHAIYSAMLFAKVTGRVFLYNNLRLVAHNYSNEANWATRIENFFSFDYDELQLKNHNYKIIDLDDIKSILKYTLVFLAVSRKKKVVFVKDHFHEYPEIFPGEYSLILTDIRKKFFLNNKEYETFGKKNSLTVLCHIRRGDVSESCVKRFTSNRVIAKRIKSLVQVFDKLNVSYSLHFVSQGRLEDFEELKKYGCFHLDESPFLHFYNMVKADILLMSKSSFSYTAAMLSEGIIFYDSFWHNPLPSWFRFGTDTIPSSQLESIILNNCASYIRN